MPLPISSSVALKTGSSRRYEVWPSSVNSYSCSRRRSQPLSSSSDSSSVNVAGWTSRWTRAKASTSSSWETGPLLSRFMTSHCGRVIPCSSRALPKCSLINLSSSRNQKSTGRRGGCTPRRGGLGGSSAAVTATSLPSDDSATPIHCSHVVLLASPYVLVRLRRILGAAPLARPPLLNALATPRMNPKLYQLPLLLTS